MVSAVYLWHTERGTFRNRELLGRALLECTAVLLKHTKGIGDLDKSQ